MKRVVVIGSGGAGKSTFSRRLHAATGLPLIHLDRLFWRPGWTEMPNEEWRATNEMLVKAEAWIIDGNYGGTMDVRLAAADTIIFLDLPRLVCLYRVLKRLAAYRRGAPIWAKAAPSASVSSFCAGSGISRK
jgi:adenylate kinase family enzyme